MPSARQTAPISTFRSPNGSLAQPAGRRLVLREDGHDHDEERGPRAAAASRIDVSARNDRGLVLPGKCQWWYSIPRSARQRRLDLLREEQERRTEVGDLAAGRVGEVEVVEAHHVAATSSGSKSSTFAVSCCADRQRVAAVDAEVERRRPVGQGGRRAERTRHRERLLRLDRPSERHGVAGRTRSSDADRGSRRRVVARVAEPPAIRRDAVARRRTAGTPTARTRMAARGRRSDGPSRRDARRGAGATGRRTRARLSVGEDHDHQRRARRSRTADGRRIAAATELRGGSPPATFARRGTPVDAAPQQPATPGPPRPAPPHRRSHLCIRTSDAPSIT